MYFGRKFVSAMIRPFLEVVLKARGLSLHGFQGMHRALWVGLRDEHSAADTIDSRTQNCKLSTVWAAHLPPVCPSFFFSSIVDNLQFRGLHWVRCGTRSGSQPRMKDDPPERQPTSNQRAPTRRYGDIGTVLVD